MGVYFTDTGGVPSPGPSRGLTPPPPHPPGVGGLAAIFPACTGTMSAGGPLESWGREGGSTAAPPGS